MGFIESVPKINFKGVWPDGKDHVLVYYYWNQMDLSQVSWEMYFTGKSNSIYQVKSNSKYLDRNYSEHLGRDLMCKKLLSKGVFKLSRSNDNIKSGLYESTDKLYD